MRPSFFHACINGTMMSTLTRLWHSIRSILSRHRRSRESRRLSSACLSSARYSPVAQTLLLTNIFSLMPSTEANWPTFTSAIP
jgi:hypothetical protein